MKKTRILSIILALAMVLSMVPMTVFAAADNEYKVTVSIEGLTLGQGFYVEPTVVTLDEINESLGGSYTGNGDLTAAMVTDVVLKKLGMDWEHGGTVSDGNFYLSSIKIGKDILNRPISIPQVIKEKGDITEADLTSRPREDWLGQMNYSSMSGWMITVDNFMIDRSAGAYPVENGSVVRWYFTLVGFGSDLGSSFMGEGFYEPADKDALYAEYARQAKEGLLTDQSKSAAMDVMTNITASQAETDAAQAALEEAGKPVIPDKPREPQNVDGVLNDTLTQLRTAVTAPGFGTGSGEWTVLALARSGHVATGDPYFAGYYDRIVTAVEEKADEEEKLGANSTENSRLILALSAIGRDATNVGGHNLIAPYDDFNWVKFQGINGPAYALIALDTLGYQTGDPTIRQQCIDYILSKEIASGGWALFGTNFDTDISAMVLQALMPYRNQPDVEVAIQRGISAMSAKQNDNGGFTSWGSENSESISQAICACTALGINPDTDSRFIKNGMSLIDSLMRFYDAETRTFKHDLAGSGVGAMSTDQASYALAAYKRLLNGQNSLYDMSDVDLVIPDQPVEPGQLTAYLSMTEKASNKPGTEVTALVEIAGWNNEAGYKLMDCAMTIPAPLEVESVTLDDAHFAAGMLDWNVDQNGKLRIVYADLDQGHDLIKTGSEDKVSFFSVHMKVAEDVDTDTEYKVTMGLDGMSLKVNSISNPEAEDYNVYIVSTSDAKDTIILAGEGGGEDPDKPYEGVVPGTKFTFTTGTLYTGDNVDLIPEGKMAIAVQVVGLNQKAKLMYKGTETIEFLYSVDASAAAKRNTYVALVDSSIDHSMFTDGTKFDLSFKTTDMAGNDFNFGDTNADGEINAQDALNVVNTWLRKTGEVTDLDILHMNVNSDSRINTFDALGVVENFVDGITFAVVNKAATLGSN